MTRRGVKVDERVLRKWIQELDSRIKDLEGQLAEVPIGPLTIRWRYIDCGKCEGRHGPYAYGYKREKGELHEYYIGREGSTVPMHRKAMAIAKQLRALNSKRHKLVKQLNKLVR